MYHHLESPKMEVLRYDFYHTEAKSEIGYNMVLIQDPGSGK